MAWERVFWVDDDGSLTTGTPFDADHMDNIERGIEEGKEELGVEQESRELDMSNEEKARIAADAAEKKSREESDAAESAARIVDVDAEEAARKSADSTEKSEREAGDNARPPALAHDASSMSAAGTGALSWTHKPTTTRPRAILVLVAQNFVTSIADQVISVAYGEQLMTRIGTQLVSGRSAVYAYLLTGKIKPGEQGVTVSVSGAASKRATAVSLAGPPLTPVKARLLAASGTGTVPSFEIGTVWDERVTYSLLSGVQNPAPGVTQTELGEHEFTSAAFAQWDVNKANTEPGKAAQAVYGTQTSGNYAGVLVSLGFTKDWGFVTELPPEAACAPGDRCTYVADDANGIEWQLVFDGKSELPWKVIGGSPLLNEIATAQETTSKVFTGLATAGPTLTLPLKGDYNITTGVQVFGAGGNALMSYKIGAATALLEDMIQIANGGGFAVVMGQRTKRKNGLAAATVLLAQYANESGSVTAFGYRSMQAMPIRVG